MNKSDRTNTLLLDSLPAQTILAARDLTWTKERIGSLWNEEPVVGDEESFADISRMRARLVTGEDFLRAALNFRRIHFRYTPGRSSGCHPYIQYTGTAYLP